MSSNAPTVGTPTVMVSSTFYDLKQVRTDISEFLASMGYSALLSEHSSFPVDPDVDTIENCRRRVERDANALVLVIGGRYGSIDNKALKSVTNIEYDAARVKGIPVFAFVDRNVASLLPIWKRNPDADFTDRVDNAKVFEFIDRVMSMHRVWSHEFDRVQEIVSVLREQFAYLTMTALRWTTMLRDDREMALLRTLGGNSLRTALDKPAYWEYKLFAHVLNDEIYGAQDLKRQLDLGVLYGVGDAVDSEGLFGWHRSRLSELQNLNSGATTLVNRAFKEAIGELGHPGNVEKIVYVARDLGRVYKEAIEWTLRVRRAAGDEELTPLLEQLSRFSSDLIEKVGKWGERILVAIGEAEAYTGSEPLEVDVSVTLTIPNEREYHEELQRYKERMGYD